MSHPPLPRLWLASASPRRRALLAQVGVPVEQRPVPVDERPLAGETAEAYVQRVARMKAEALWAVLDAEQLPQAVVLGADTTVVLDGHLLGKPRDRADAVQSLLQLSGRWHRVLTAVTVVSARGHGHCCVAADVKLRCITAAEAAAYWDTGEPADKAGGYAIQGLGAVLVESLRGSYSAVVGLPLMETAALLQQQGVPVWQGASDGH